MPYRRLPAKEAGPAVGPIEFKGIELTTPNRTVENFASAGSNRFLLVAGLQMAVALASLGGWWKEHFRGFTKKSDCGSVTKEGMISTKLSLNLAVS